ncbi:MAG: hypothetical protein ACRCX5_14475 [Bacteroidales bacterium]
MKFNQPCFIRKNTPELIEYLQIIGYRTLHKRRLHLSTGIFVQPPNWYGGFKDEPNWDYEELEDCGTNEELFKAIAALRDDTDDKQLFTDGNGYWQTCVGRFRFKNQPFFKLHKATVEELIEYFKNK